MFVSRRQFLQRSAAATALGTFQPWGGLALPDTPVTQERLAAQARPIDPDLAHTLTRHAIDAARTAGAQYADVRLTRSVSQTFFALGDGRGSVNDYESLAVGVRVLVNGSWGFAASPYWVLSEMDHLAQLAVAQARANAGGISQHVDLGPPQSATGSWTMPGIDPFSISIEEKLDFLHAWIQAVIDTPKLELIVRMPEAPSMSFSREERILASTEGTYIAQTVYNTSGTFKLQVGHWDWRGGPSVEVSARGLDSQGKGWELFLDANPGAQIPALLAEADVLLKLQGKPVEVGRYDVVFEAGTLAHILDATLGTATELDRAMGYEANAGGTSYLGPDPLRSLGTVVGSPLLTVMANRSMPGGLATAKWDDEGVEPDEFMIVRDGRLVDYQTIREQMAWLTPWYTKQHLPVRSHGCAGAPSALYTTMQHSPNLSVLPGADTVSFDDLVKGTTRGLAITDGWTDTDFQAKAGIIRGSVREIKDGKLGAVISGAGVLFNSSEFWKNITAIGGPGSTASVAIGRSKGQPEQQMMHTVTAVPAKVKDANIIDVTRRA